MLKRDENALGGSLKACCTASGPLVSLLHLGIEALQVVFRGGTWHWRVRVAPAAPPTLIQSPTHAHGS